MFSKRNVNFNAEARGASDLMFSLFLLFRNVVLSGEESQTFNFVFTNASHAPRWSVSSRTAASLTSPRLSKTQHGADRTSVSASHGACAQNH